ncbi:MAG: putative toxin-antitoxin system toxin component, PIN family, partial [Lachnoclostridium sp.]|nr:putative toxin-antitoxin system toxin component, PIN family [Lachnoclostridium sp.]
MTCYAVIDTNVLVSSLLSSHADAATVQVVGKLFTGEIISLFSAEIIEEYDNVLHRKKFPFSESVIERLMNVIRKHGILVQPTPSGEILPDMKDLPFYEVVLEKQEDNAYLVTGNMKHFPVKPFIVTADQMLG